MTEELKKVLIELKTWVVKLAAEAGKPEDYADIFWKRICASDGMLRELAYYHDTGDFLCEKKVAGFSAADMAVWQVDHFKAYLDRGDKMLRYNSAGLLLAAFENLMNLEDEPEKYTARLQSESGTDSPDALVVK